MSEQGNSENPESKKTEKKNLIEMLLEHPFYLILGVVFVVYARTFFFEYTNYDDHHFLFENDYQIEKLQDIGTALGSPYLYSTYYRPIENLSFYIDAQIAGESSFDNLLSHLHRRSLHS